MAARSGERAARNTRSIAEARGHAQRPGGRSRIEARFQALLLRVAEHAGEARGLQSAGASPSTRRKPLNDLFSPMSSAERAAFPEHYMRYLRARDGTPCLTTRTLSRREPLFRQISGSRVRMSGRPVVDPEVFQRNLARCAPEPGLDAPTRWALAVAKGNRAERYGVEYKLASRGFEPSGIDDILTYVEIQECYHTRVLLHVLDVLGLECDVGEPVGSVTRAGVRLFSQLPRPALDVLALAFEIIGVAAFHAMRVEARRLFADQPGPLARIDALFAQILVDEVGHVHFLRSRLGAGRLALARAVLVFAKWSLFNDNDEIRSLLEERGALLDLGSLDVDALVDHDAERLPALDLCGAPTC